MITLKCGGTLPWLVVSITLILLMIGLAIDLWRFRKYYYRLFTVIDSKLHIVGSLFAVFSIYFFMHTAQFHNWISAVTSFAIGISTYLVLSGIFQLRFTSSFVFGLLLTYLAATFSLYAVYFTQSSPTDFGKNGMFSNALPPSVVVDANGHMLCGVLINHVDGYWYLIGQSQAKNSSAGIIALRDATINSIAITESIVPSHPPKFTCSIRSTIRTSNAHQVPKY